MQNALQLARTRTPVLVRKAAHSSLARRALVAALVAGPTVYNTAFAAGEGELTAENFTGVATKILTYLGFAVAAGLTVLVAYIAAQAGWRFFQKFLAK